jgi:hypothetical protein
MWNDLEQYIVKPQQNFSALKLKFATEPTDFFNEEEPSAADAYSKFVRQTIEQWTLCFLKTFPQPKTCKERKAIFENSKEVFDNEFLAFLAFCQELVGDPEKNMNLINGLFQELFKAKPQRIDL